MPLLGTTSAGVWEALVTSWRGTRRQSRRVVGLLLAVTIPAGVASFLLAALTIAPTIATDLLRPAASPWMAAVLGFTVWQIGRFVARLGEWARVAIPYRPAEEKDV